MGEMTMTFADGRTHHSFSDREVRTGEETMQPKGFDSPPLSYEPLYSGEYAVVFSVTWLDTGKRIA